MDAKTEIKQILRDTKREGIEELISYMENEGFFESAAAPRSHGTYVGGLADHSLNVYNEYKVLNERLALGLQDDTISICSILHDLCKVGAYEKKGDGYARNPYHPRAHSKLSIKRAKGFIRLTEEEELIIRFHMGIYHTHETGFHCTEYSIAELVKAFDNRACKAFHISDELATHKEIGQMKKYSQKEE